ncbi:hypothetical protein ACSAGD_15225 [Paramicrobacterium sp. CJ85]
MAPPYTPEMPLALAASANCFTASAKRGFTPDAEPVKTVTL